MSKVIQTCSSCAAVSRMEPQSTKVFKDLMETLAKCISDVITCSIKMW